MARRNTIIVKCDGGCETVVEIDEKETTYPGWYQLQVSNEDGKFHNHRFDICSLKCVIAWSAARAEAVGEDLGAKARKSAGTFKKYPCPSCGKECAPQGFRTHWNETHSDEMPYEDAKVLYDSNKEAMATP